MKVRKIYSISQCQIFYNFRTLDVSLFKNKCNPYPKILYNNKNGDYSQGNKSKSGNSQSRSCDRGNNRSYDSSLTRTVVTDVDNLNISLGIVPVIKKEDSKYVETVYNKWRILVMFTFMRMKSC